MLSWRFDFKIKQKKPPFATVLEKGIFNPFF